MLKATAVLLALLTSVCAFAALGPGPEHAVSAPEYAPLPGGQDVADVATDGTGFLVIWRDNTQGREGFYGSIVNDDGTVRTLTPIPLTGSQQASVRAVWTGNHYLVAITEPLEPMLIVRLDRDGELAGPDYRIDVWDLAVWSLVWNGERVLAITSSSLGTIHGSLLDADGHLIRGMIPLPATNIFSVQANAVNGAFLLTWADVLPREPGITVDTHRIRAARISSEGDVSEPVEVMEPLFGSVVLSTASNGSEVALAVKRTFGLQTTLHRYTIDASLAVHAEEPFTLEPNVFGGVAAVATPRGFVAVYVASMATSVKVLPFGSTTLESILLPAAAGYHLRFASNGSSLLAFGQQALAAAFDPSLTHATTGVFRLTSAPVRQDGPVLANAGNTGIIVWNELGTLKLRRIADDGDFLDAQPLVVATGLHGFFRPAAAFTGRLWLIAYVDREEGVKVQRVTRDGALHGDPMTLGIEMSFLAFASNGSISALVMTSGMDREGLGLVRFTASGDPMDATPIVLDDRRSIDDPAIASDGEGFLVVYSYSSDRSPQVYGKRLDAFANPIDAEPIAIATNENYSHGMASVASDGGGYVVAYVQFDLNLIYDPPIDVPPPTPHRIRTKRVLGTGNLDGRTADQEGTHIALGTLPEITFDGQQYVTTFRKESDDELWLFGVTLDTEGVPATTLGQLVRAKSYEPRHSTVAIGGRVYTAYSRIDPELSRVQRVFVREVRDAEARRRGRRIRPSVEEGLVVR